MKQSRQSGIADRAGGPQAEDRTHAPHLEYRSLREEQFRLRSGPPFRSYPASASCTTPSTVRYAEAASRPPRRAESMPPTCTSSRERSRAENLAETPND